MKRPLMFVEVGDKKKREGLNIGKYITIRLLTAPHFKAPLRNRFWWHWRTPCWHEGRGPYITIGLGIIAFYRGY